MKLDMRIAYSGMKQKGQYIHVSKEIDDGEAVESESDPIPFWGCFQPLRPNEILIKPEGQRTWMWWRVWASVRLELDDIVFDPEGRRFRVLSRENWRGIHNMFVYEIAEAVA